MKNLLSLLLFLSFLEFSKAQVADSLLKIDGFVKSDNIGYFKNEDNKINGRLQGILQLNVKSEFSEKVSFKGSLEFREDLMDATRNRVFIKELNLSYYSKHADFTIGKQFYNWGQAWAVNPSNIVNPVDYSDILDVDNERIGVYSISSRLYVGNLQIEGVFVPMLTPSVLPSSNSRWFHSLNAVMSNPMNPDSLVNVTYQFSPPFVETALFEHPQFALRLNGDVNGFEYAASYYKGYSNIPFFSNSITFLSSNTASISIQSIYYKLQTVALELSKPLGEYVFRGEAVCFFPSEAPINNPYLKYVVGIDHTFNSIIGNSNIFTLIQWMNEIPLRGSEYSYTDFNHLFQQSLMCKIEFDNNLRLKAGVETIYNFRGNDYYFRPFIKYNIAEGLNINVFADILDGDDNGFFGSYKNNKRIQLLLKYNF